MKRFGKVTLVLLSFVLALGIFFGCAKKEEPKEETPQAAGEKQQLTIGLAVSTLNNPFFVDMRDGAQAAADQAGAKLIVVDAQDDASRQVSQVENLIQQKVDVILLNPTDSDGLVTAVNDANAAKIPVVTLDRAVNGGTVASHIASDNIEGGRLAADYIVKQLGGKGNVVELEGIAGTSAARDRGQGFHEVMDKQTGMKVVARQPADFDRSKGLTVMENIQQSQPEINAVFAHNDEMALGALQAVQAAKKDIMIVGFDGTPDGVKAVNEGSLAATVAQQPKQIGELGVQTAQKISKGEKVNTNIPAELKLLTKKSQ